MSKSLDMLDKAVTAVVKDASGKSFTKDNLIEVIDDNIGFLRNASGFFKLLSADADKKLRDYLAQNRTNTKLQSIAIYNRIFSGIGSLAQRSMNERFLGAIQDTLAGLALILEDVNENIDTLFADKSITLYNAKISQVAIFGMISNAEIFSRFVVEYIALFMSDRSESLFKPVPASLKLINDNVDTVIEMINRVIGNKISKTFVNAVKKYRNSGSDTTVVNSENKATVQFAKVNTDVTDSDIKSGAKGICIFRWIGNFFVDRNDTKIRKLRAEREMLQARAQLLELELDGSSEDSPEYKKQVEIIKNYQKMIDRLNQQIAKLEED